MLISIRKRRLARNSIGALGAKGPGRPNLLATARTDSHQSVSTTFIRFAASDFPWLQGPSPRCISLHVAGFRCTIGINVRGPPRAGQGQPRSPKRRCDHESLNGAGASTSWCAIISRSAFAKLSFLFLHFLKLPISRTPYNRLVLDDLMRWCLKSFLCRNTPTPSGLATVPGLYEIMLTLRSQAHAPTATGQTRQQKPHFLL